MVRAAVWSVAAAIALAACGDDTAPHGDAGTGIDAAVSDAGSIGASVDPPAPPMAEPAMPDLAPCPDGFVSVPAVDANDVPRCDPFPDGLSDCPPREARLVGASACAPIGAPCPAGDYATDLPAGARVLYVRSSAPAGGDGRMGSPFRAIGDALAVASDGDVIALSKGTFDERIAVGTGVRILGACAAETTIAPSAPSEDEAAVTITAASVSLDDLTIAGAGPGLIAQGSTASATLTDVVTEGARAVGWAIEGGAELVARRAVVRDTATTAGGTGRGVEVTSGSVRLEDVIISGSHTQGIFASGPDAVVDLFRTVVARTQGDAGGSFGDGVRVAGGTVLRIAESVVAENRNNGVRALGPSTTVTIADTLVRDTQPAEADGSGGVGLGLSGGAIANVSRTVFDGNTTVGVAAHEAGTTLTLRDVVVSRTQSRPDGLFGDGVNAVSGAAITIERALLRENRNIALKSTLTGSSVDATDLVVFDTLVQEGDGLGGEGLHFELGGQMTVRRARIERSRAVAIAGGDVSRAAAERNGVSRLVLEDAVVRDTLGIGGDGPSGGVGVSVQSGVIEARRCVFERNRAWGVVVLGELGEAVLEDVVVRDTESDASDGSLGAGCGAGSGARLVATRVAIDESRAVGLFAVVGGQVEGTHVTVLGTRRAACAEAGCGQQEGGFGAIALAGGSVRLDLFEVAESEVCGVSVANGASLDLSNGLVARQPIGANIQDPTFDLDRIRDNVAYVDNEVALDSTALALPDPEL